MTSDTASEDVLVVGSLELGEADQARWLASPLTSAALADAPTTFQLDARLDDDEGVTVKTWLDDYARYEAAAGVHFLDLVRGDGALTVRGRVLRETYDAYKRPIAAIFRLAGICGARGVLVFAATAEHVEPFGYRLSVSGPISEFQELRGDALAAEVRRAEQQTRRG